jgi:hypothetical protein
METGKTGKYFKYAIGEILLVMIGILLALQVNNWNESRKEQVIELEYLIGIKKDLEEDLPFIESRMSKIINKISALHKIDSTYNPEKRNSNIKLQEISLDSISIDDIFNRGPLFRLTTGTYNALIANSHAGLIKNLELKQSIQELYGITTLNIQSIYEDLRTRGEFVIWKYSSELKYSDIQSFFIDNPNKNQVIADFDIYYRRQETMYHFLGRVRNFMIDIKDSIATEIEQDN